MNVGQLKKKLDLVDDNVVVVTSGFDHSYNKVFRADIEDSAKINNEYYETYGDENHTVIEKVLVIE